MSSDIPRLGMDHLEGSGSSLSTGEESLPPKEHGSISQLLAAHPGRQAPSGRNPRGTVAAISCGALVLLAFLGCGERASREGRNAKENIGTAQAVAESLETAGNVVDAYQHFRDTTRRFPLEGWAWEGVGRNARRLGRDVEALDAFRTALRRDPGRVGAQRELAELELEYGSPENALRAIDEALQLAGDVPELLAIRHRILLATNRIAESQTILQRIREVAPTDPHVSLCRIAALVAADSVDQALSEANGLCRAHPNDPRALEVRASLLDRAGDPSGAMADYQSALERDPNRPRARHQLAQLFLRGGQNDAAEKEFQFLLQNHPGDFRALEGLGAVAMTRGDRAGAEELIRNAIDSAPEEAAPHFALGNFLLESGRTQEGIEELRKARARASLNLPLWEECSVALAEAHLILNEPTNALEIGESVLARLPESPTARSVRARALASEGGGDDSGPTLERLAAREEATTEEVEAYAEWLAKRGDFGRALAVLETTGSGDSTTASVETLRGWIFASQGQDREAEVAWTKALARDSTHTAAIEFLGRQALSLRNWDGAVQWAKRGLEAERRAVKTRVRPGGEEHGAAAFHLMEGEALYERGDWASADTAFAAATSAGARTSKAEIFRARVEDRQGKTQEAVQRLRRQLERNEADAASHATLAWILAHREIDAAEAEVEARRALQLDPEEPAATLALAWAIYKSGRAEEAWDLVAGLQFSAARRPQVSYVRGILAAEVDREREARDLLRDVVEAAPAGEFAEAAREWLAEHGD